MRPLSRRAFAQLALAATACSRDEREVARPSSPEAPAPSASAAHLEAAPESRSYALARKWPRMAERLAWLPLAALPTPVEEAKQLGRALGIPLLFVKRDDLSGALYGGGKTRKLALLLGRARALGAREVVTFGSVGSNQAVATALYGRDLGLRVTLVLAPGPADSRTRGNLLAAVRAGASFRVARAGLAAAEAEARIAEARGGPYVVPAGGSSPLGNLAFVDAGLELAEQITAGNLPVPSRVYVAMGTMGSAVGLSLGLAAAGLPTVVVAVRASSPTTSSAPRLAALTRETLALARELDPSVPLLLPRVILEGRQLGAGYARPTRAGRRAVSLAEEHEGWQLEPTYTGKTLAALAADASVLGDAPVVFWSSHSSRPLVTEDASPESLPPPLRLYLEGRW